MSFPLKKEIKILWLLSVVVSLFILTTAMGYRTSNLDNQAWYKTLSAAAERYHDGERCIFCGMVHSFNAIAHGDMRSAREYNRLGPFLFSILVLNLFCGMVIFIKNLSKGAS